MSSTGPETRALVVVFDALRPEFVTPELMPNLHAFACNGVRYVNSRSTFPSETRVNQSAVTTGCYPSRHGVVANKFVIADGGDRAVLNTGDDVAFEAALNRMSEPLFDVPTLGQRLAAADKSYATISAGTSGGGRLINMFAEQTNSFRFAMRRPEAAAPAGVAADITKRIGPLPEYTRPAIDWITYAVDCYLDYVEPDVHPNVMLLWLCEPDESFHHLGIGSPEALKTIRHADSEFGRILAHHKDEISNGTLQIITLSDHGQISLRGEPLDLMSKFRDAGFVPASDGTETGLNVVISNAGGVWLENPEPGQVAEIAQWLQVQDWCGPIFTRDGAAGTLTHDRIRVDHRRAPDVALALRYDDADNNWGCKGMSLHDSIYPVGGGSHGGLSPFEMHNVLAMSGKRFKSGFESGVPAGNVDIMPTILHLLGTAVPDDIDGRVLSEALDGGPDDKEMNVIEKSWVSGNEKGASTHLSTSQVGGTPYINRAWVE